MSDMPDNPSDSDKLITVEAVAPGVVSIKIDGGTRTVTPEEARIVASAIHEAANVASFVEADYPEWHRRFMQYLVLEVRTHPDLVQEGHALQECRVHCWVRDQTQSNAFYVSTGWINDAGWVVTGVVEHRDVIRDVFESSDHIKYYDQALIDGQVFYFDTSPDTRSMDPQHREDR